MSFSIASSFCAVNVELCYRYWSGGTKFEWAPRIKLTALKNVVYVFIIHLFYLLLYVSSSLFSSYGINGLTVRDCDVLVWLALSEIPSFLLNIGDFFVVNNSVSVLTRLIAFWCGSIKCVKKVQTIIFRIQRNIRQSRISIYKLYLKNPNHSPHQLLPVKFSPTFSKSHFWKFSALNENTNMVFLHLEYDTCMTDCKMRM